MRYKMKFFLMLALAAFFLSCNEIREPEIINTTEKNSYMSWENLAPDLKGGFEYGSTEWKTVSNLLEQQSRNEPERFKKPGFTFRSVIYFSETGNIEKIVLLESINAETDEAVIKFIRNTLKVNPPELNFKPVRFHTDFTFNYSTAGLNFFPRSDNFLMPETEDEDEYKSSVDEMPVPAKGIEDIGKRMKYPEEAKKQGIEGKVLVKLLIDETGNPISSRIIKGIHPLLDAEAKDVLMKTKFIPGKDKGKAVKVQVVVPIAFRLK
jgi:TonB family protein